MLTKKQIPLIYLFLAIAALIAFWQVNQCDFINYDDPSYVTENISIRDGITTEAIWWAFTTGYSANWHPVTWMSHMLDVQLFGLKPRWHHLTNLLFHITNTLLLFFVFHRMTKAPWKSAFVAALFAIHPLHVESVAWVAERKDVLSAFFWMLATGAYIHYVERPQLKNYLAVLIFFALGLMAKPMLVTLPFVLLLLDYWPLQRFEPKKAARQALTEASRQEARTGAPGAGSAKQTTSRAQKPLSANKRKSRKKLTDLRIAPHSVPVTPEVFNPGPQSSVLSFQSSALRRLLLEKIPFFALTALSCIVTYVVQQKGGTVASIGTFSPGVRIANAFVSYIVYITKTILPVNLAVYYPHHEPAPLWEVFGAALLLIAVTTLVIRAAKRFPYLTVGWLWFTGTLVPVIGIVQVGAQAMADRYTYIPLIGLFVMAAWGIPELLKKWRPTHPPRKEALFALPALVLLPLFIVTWTQAGHWRNSIALSEHSLKAAGPSDVIYFLRGLAYDKAGNYGQAISDYDRAIEITPNYALAYNNRGIAYRKLGNHRQAISDFDRVIEIDPKYAEAYNNRGIVYDKLGNQRQAISDFDRAIEANPKRAEVYYNRGIAYAKLGYDSKAIEDMKTAARFDLEEAKKALRNMGINW